MSDSWNRIWSDSWSHELDKLDLISKRGQPDPANATFSQCLDAYIVYRGLRRDVSREIEAVDLKSAAAFPKWSQPERLACHLLRLKICSAYLIFVMTEGFFAQRLADFGPVPRIRDDSGPEPEDMEAVTYPEPHDPLVGHGYHAAVGRAYEAIEFEVARARRFARGLSATIHPDIPDRGLLEYQIATHLHEMDRALWDHLHLRRRDPCLWNECHAFIAGVSTLEEAIEDHVKKLMTLPAATEAQLATSNQRSGGTGPEPPAGNDKEALAGKAGSQGDVQPPNGQEDGADPPDDGEYETIQWFTENTFVPAERIRKAAKRESKPVRSKKINGVVFFCKEDVALYWSDEYHKRKKEPGKRGE